MNVRSRGDAVGARGMVRAFGVAPFVVLCLLALPAAAAPPQPVARAVKAWHAAIASGPQAIVALLGPDGRLEITQGNEGTLTVDAPELARRLAAGEANRLGLDAFLLLPPVASFRRINGRYVGADRHCPEVRWTFALARGKARLVAIHRVFLSC